jgi:DNA primase
MSVVDEIKDRIDIAEVISETVKLRKSGKNFVGFCPFHPNTRTPAFVVFPDTGTWRCFGACNEGGDVFRFLMKKEGWDFPEALRYLAGRAGVQLRPQTPAEEARKEAHERLRQLLETVVPFYRGQLLQSDAGADVLSYLRGRGFSNETLEVFEVGYAPDSWDATRTFLQGREYSEKELLDAGLVSERETGGTYDRFRNRIMIPIRDARGRLTGFGARIVNPEDVPKFLNSPQTALFDKGRLLYGLDKARKAIRSEDQVVLVEGYMDVMGLYQAGFKNVVSAMGTALSEHQLRLLKRYSRNIVLALDPDAAGSKATLRGLSLARETLEREVDPIFDARGLIRHEGRLDAEIRVVTLPGELDPDEVVAEDPAKWDELIHRAQPIVDYVLDVLVEGQDIDDPKVKARIAGQVLPLIEDVVNSVEREAYRQHLARRLRVDERALVDWRPRSRRGRATPRRTSVADLGALPKQVSDLPLERFCLGLLLQNPELLYRIDRQFQALELERLGERDFVGVEHQLILEVIQFALKQEDEEPAIFWRGKLSESLLATADGMISELSELAGFAGLELEQPKVSDEITARFLQLRKRALEGDLSKLQFLLQSAGDPSEGMEEGAREEISAYQREIQKHAMQKAKLEQALAHKQGSVMTSA